MIWNYAWLVEQLQRELQRSRIASHRCDRAEAPCRIVEGVQVCWLSELRRVGGIKGLGSELQTNGFGESEVLED